MTNLWEELRRTLKGELLFDEPLSRHTSFGIGGPVDALAYPSDLKDLKRISKFVGEKDAPILFIGGGTNLLVNDSGFRGVAVKLGRAFSQTSFSGEDATVGTGASLSSFSGHCAREGLSGLEFAWGIPGTVGGAIKGNAGAFGEEIFDTLLEVDGINMRSGEPFRLKKDQIDFSYHRTRIPPHLLITNARFRLRPDEPQRIWDRMDNFLKQRTASQPVREKSAGCIFRNPPLGSAARLIDQASCKGMSVGDATVSDLHANFIVNRSGAKAADVLKLIDRVRARVREKIGVDLELEIQVVEPHGYMHS